MVSYREGDTATPFLYNGAYGVMTDAESGLLNMRARYYHPWIGRFASPDPIGFSGGQNWYAYADGNPVSFADPMGLTALYLWTEHQLRATDDPTFFPRVAAAMAAANLEYASASGNHYVPGEDASEQVVAPFSQLPRLSREVKNITNITVVGHPADYQPNVFSLQTVSTANVAAEATIRLYGCTAGAGVDCSGQRFADHFQRTTYAPPGGVSFGFGGNIALSYARTPLQESDLSRSILPVKMSTFTPQNKTKRN
jgi:RHS repeat-associated protein